MRRLLLSTPTLVLVALSLLMVVPPLAGEFIVIEDVNMEPTLLQGDVVWSQKIFRKGYNVPNRGTLVSFHHEGKNLIRRVIGLPGDRIKVEDGQVTVNGESSPIVAAEGTWFDLRDKLTNGTITRVFTETMAGHKYHIGLMAKRFVQSPLDDYPQNGYYFRVPEGHLFVLSDNRNLANDSRMFGPIAIDRLQSQVRVLAFSRDPQQVARVRMSRMFEIF